MRKILNSKLLASNRLYSGDVESFPEAMRLIQDQGDEELARQYDFASSWGGDHDSNEYSSLRQLVDRQQAAAREALAIYQRFVQEAEQRCARYLKRLAAERRDEDLALIAQALASGDYTTLAI